MAKPLIDFDLIRSKISLRDENLSHDFEKLDHQKIASLITPYCIQFKNDDIKRRYIELFNHLCGTLEYLFKVKVITPHKFLKITEKYVVEDYRLIINTPDHYEIRHLNLNPRNYLFYQIGNRKELISCPQSDSFMHEEYLTDFRQLFNQPDQITYFTYLPQKISLNEICITKNYAIISTALEKQYKNIKKELSDFLRLKIITFRSPDNSTDITKYFRSIDSAPSLNISESFSVNNNSKLIYAETGIQTTDSKIKLVIDEVNKIDNTTTIKFKNPPNNKLINYLDFSMLDGSFLFPLHDEIAYENKYYLAEHFPQNFFLSTMHPDLDLVNKNGVNFANMISVSMI